MSGSKAVNVMTKVVAGTCLLMLALPLFSRTAGAARAASDFLLWTDAGITYDITKRFRFEFDQHVRWMDNASKIESISPEFALHYKLLKFFTVGGGYRLIIEPDT